VAAALALAQPGSPPSAGDDTQLWACNASDARQRWLDETSAPAPGSHLTLAGSLNGTLDTWLLLTAAANYSGAEAGLAYNGTSNSSAALAAAAARFLAERPSPLSKPVPVPVRILAQQWRFVPGAAAGGALLQNPASGNCLASRAAEAGAAVLMLPCNASDALQSWSRTAVGGAVLVSLAAQPPGGVCLAAGSSVAGCADAPFSARLYCNPDAYTTDRVADLVPRLEPYEWAQLLFNKDLVGAPRLGVPRIWFGESLHGTVSGCGAPFTDNATGFTSTGCPTSFPHALALGSTLNRSLWSAIGAAISTENRGLHNQGAFNAASIFWAPSANACREQVRDSRRPQGLTASAARPALTPTPSPPSLSPLAKQTRSPRWGRCQEVPSEDGFLVGDYAARYARAMQEGEDPRYLKSVSTAKCYSVYDVENSDGTDRFRFNATVSDHDWVSDLTLARPRPQPARTRASTPLARADPNRKICAALYRTQQVEYYALPYRLAVQHGHVGSMMCGYPAVNGVPNCMNAFYTNTVAHELWGWDGFLVSDCGGVIGIYQQHHVAASPEEAVAFSIKGGLQVACDTAFPLYMADAVAEGLVALDDLRAAALQFLPWAFRYGVMDPPERQPYKKLGPADVDTPAHRQLALEAAVQSAVLLQNKNVSGGGGGGGGGGNASSPVLPLSAARLRRVALIGPLANESADLLSNYHGDNVLVANHSLLAAFSARAAADGFALDFAQGCGPNAGCDDQLGFPAALAAARAADVAIVALGLCVASCSGSDNRWHEGEGHDRGVLDLPGNQSALALAVAATGTPTVVVLVHGGPVALENITGAVAAIVDLHYGGELGGDAGVHVLFGDSPAAASGRLTTTFYPASFISTRKVTDMNLSSNEGLTYMYYTGTPVFEFGWGMSYTSFSFAWASPPHVAVDAADWAAGLAQPPSYSVNVTNTGARASDVSAMAFFSTGVAGEPLTELFDFARAAALAPGATVTLHFTLSPEVAATVSAEGVQALTPGVFRVRIGDVARTGNFVEGSVELRGSAPAVLMDMPALRAVAKANGVVGA
jgi:beta-glucosidase-like glycosyl hydrolase